MNKTTLQHFLIALAALVCITIMGLLINPTLGQLWVGIGAGVGIGIFVGREHAQAEYRWMRQFGDGTRASLPWWGAFDYRMWLELDPWLDWLVPLAGNVLAVGLALFFHTAR